MQLDTLEGISKLIEEHGFDIQIKEYNVERHQDVFELNCFGTTDVQYCPGHVENELIIRATLIEKRTGTDLSELQEAIRRFDDSVTPFEEI